MVLFKTDRYDALGPVFYIGHGLKKLWRLFLMMTSQHPISDLESQGCSPNGSPRLSMTQFFQQTTPFHDTQEGKHNQ